MTNLSAAQHMLLGHGIACPGCGHLNQDVKDSRPTSGAIWRRRKCKGCGNRFSTYEIVAEDVPAAMIVRLKRIAEKLWPVLGEIDDLGTDYER